MSAPLNSYRISVVEWTLLEISVEAADPEAAIREARDIFERGDFGLFRHRDNGTESWEVIGVDS